MATKESKAAPTKEELLAQFEDLGNEASKSTKSSTSKPSTKQAAPSQSEQDLLAELGNLATQRPTSRPPTPSLKSTTATGAGSKSPEQTSSNTPVAGGRSSEDRPAVAAAAAQPRKSGESTRSFHQSFTPATTEESPEPEPKPAPVQPSGGGWWGGLLSTATAAVSQAQAAVKEIQKNEEAQRWAEQVRGNVGVLKGFGRLN